MKRSLAALSLGSLATLAVFWLMMQLVTAPLPGSAAPTLQAVQFLRLQRPPEPEPEREPEQPPPQTQVTAPIVDTPRPPPTPMTAPALARLALGRFAPGEFKHGLDIHGLPYLGVMSDQPVLAPPQALVVLKRVPPLYPRRALRRKVEGWVEVALSIAPDGSVSTARVLRAEPAGTFERAALKAVKRWRFQPQTRRDTVQATQRIEFSLDG